MGRVCLSTSASASASWSRVIYNTFTYAYTCTSLCLCLGPESYNNIFTCSYPCTVYYIFNIFTYTYTCTSLFLCLARVMYKYLHMSCTCTCTGIPIRIRCNKFTYTCFVSVSWSRAIYKLYLLIYIFGGSRAICSLFTFTCILFYTYTCTVQVLPDALRCVQEVKQIQGSVQERLEVLGAVIYVCVYK